MYKSKFIQIVKTFSKDELKGFRDFVKSPVHNSNKNVIKAVDIIRKFYPVFDSLNLSKEKIFKKLHPEKKYNDVVMRILISDLLKLSEKYLINLRLTKCPFEEKKLLLDELESRKLSVLFEKHYSQAKSFLNNESQTSVEYFYYRSELEQKKLSQMISTDRTHSAGEILLEEANYFATYSLLKLLNLSYDLKSYDEVLNTRFEFNFCDALFENIDIDAVLNYTEKKKHKHLWLISMYYFLYKSSENINEDTYYFKFKESVYKNLKNLERREQFNLLLALENACVSRLHLNTQKYYTELFGIYKTMLANGVYTHSETELMQTNLFRNIINTAIVMNELDWAEKFINNYIGELGENQKENFFHFSKAVLCFEKGLFNEALTEINKIKFYYIAFKYDAKILSAKIFYELELFDSALSQIDSFNHFLTNNKGVTPLNKERFSNFNKYLKVIIEIKEKKNKTDPEMLKRKLLKENIVSRKWLLEKIESIILD